MLVGPFSTQIHDQKFCKSFVLLINQFFFLSTNIFSIEHTAFSTFASVF